jgi:hypothetical protein
MTNPGRLKDLADVQELIREIRPPRELGEKLNKFVQEKFYEFWDLVESQREAH